MGGVLHASMRDICLGMRSSRWFGSWGLVVESDLAVGIMVLTVVLHTRYCFVVHVAWVALRGHVHVSHEHWVRDKRAEGLRCGQQLVWILGPNCECSMLLCRGLCSGGCACAPGLCCCCIAVLQVAKQGNWTCCAVVWRNYFNGFHLLIMQAVAGGQPE